MTELDICSSKKSIPPLRSYDTVFAFIVMLVLSREELKPYRNWHGTL